MSGQGYNFGGEKAQAIKARVRDLELSNALRLVDTALASIARISAARPKSYLGGAYGRWNQQRNESEALIAATLRGHGATIALESELVRVRFAGVSASSTQALGGALRNWKTAAEKRLRGAGR